MGPIFFWGGSNLMQMYANFPTIVHEVWVGNIMTLVHPSLRKSSRFQDLIFGGHKKNAPKMPHSFFASNLSADG